MRELSRFRDDFHTMYSLRSKFIKTKNISNQLAELLKQNSEVLSQEKQVLAEFDRKKKQLMHRKETKTFAMAND